MVSPISVQVQARPSTVRETSPLSMVLVVPKIDIGATADDDVTITAPDGELTEITQENEDAQLGSNSFARVAYDTIESGAVVRVFVLPFAVGKNDSASDRKTKVVTALNALDSVDEQAKLPHGQVDFIVMPREAGLGSTAAANTVFAKLKTFGLDTSLGAISITDAGYWPNPSPVDATPLPADPTQANAVAWRANNADPNILTISNRGNVAGWDGMWGSVIAAAHWARYSSLFGVHHQPTNLRDTLHGVDTILPERIFNESDGSSSAITLASTPNFLSSLMTWNGQHYLWGGKTAWPANDPRQDVANNLISKRMVKEAKRDLATFVGLRATRRNLESMALTVENDLTATYVPQSVETVEVLGPTISGGHVSVQMEVSFYDFIDSVSLMAEIFVPSA